MLAFSITDESSIASAPIEKGSFANYNKVDTPIEISARLALSGNKYVLDAAIDDLAKLKNSLDLVTFETPEFVRDSLNITAFSYSKSYGIGVIAVDISLIEVRQVETNVTTTVYSRPAVKNPSSTTTSDTGQTNTEENRRSSWWKWLTAGSR